MKNLSYYVTAVWLIFISKYCIIIIWKMIGYIRIKGYSVRGK